MLPVRSFLALKLCLEVDCARVNIYYAHILWIALAEKWQIYTDCASFVLVSVDTVVDSRRLDGLKLSVSCC